MRDLTRMQRRYWNTNGIAIAIVAVVNAGIDWSAYIGATTDCEQEQTAVDWAAQKGAKLSRKHAKFLFPNIREPYRE